MRFFCSHQISDISLFPDDTLRIELLSPMVSGLRLLYVLHKCLSEKSYQFTKPTAVLEIDSFLNLHQNYFMSI